MWSIIIVLLVGMTIGIVIKPTDKFKKTVSKFQFLGVMILLFAMGAGLGLNDELLSNIKTMGWEAFVFAAFTSVFSILIVYLTTKVFMKGR